MLKANDDKSFFDFRSGSPGTFKMFLSENHLVAFNYANKFLKDPLHAEEVVLEVFSLLWELKAEYTTFSDAYAFVICKIDRICRAYLTECSEDQEVVKNIHSISPHNRRSRKIIRYKKKKHEQLLNRYEQFILQLSNHEKQLYILYFVIDKSIASISSILNESYRSISLIVKAIIAKLEKLRLTAEGDNYKLNRLYVFTGSCAESPEFTIEIENNYHNWLVKICYRIQDVVYAEIMLLHFLLKIWHRRRELKKVSEIADLMNKFIEEEPIKDSRIKGYGLASVYLGNKSNILAYLKAYKETEHMDLVTRCIILLSYFKNVQIVDISGMFCIEESKTDKLIRSFRKTMLVTTT